MSLRLHYLTDYFLLEPGVYKCRAGIHTKGFDGAVDISKQEYQSRGHGFESYSCNAGHFRVKRLSYGCSIVYVKTESLYNNKELGLGNS